MADDIGEYLILEKVYEKETKRADALYLTQPMGGTRVETYSWARTLDEARRLAAYIRKQNFPPKSQIAMLSKNCAQFFITDLAIWMAGHVSVALYPTLNADTVKYILEHSESKMLFVGKLDTWDEMKPGVPDDLPQVSYPLSPDSVREDDNVTHWNDILADNEPIEDSPTRDADDLAIIVYTSGSTGRPKGVMHSFRTMGAAARGVIKALGLGEERVLSYLPLAHVFERFAIETMTLILGGQVFFAESLDTFVQDLQRARPTMFVSVPRLWLKFQQGVFKKMPPGRLDFLLKVPILNNVIRKKILTGLGLQDARLAVSGSAPIPPELISWYKNLGLELLEGYGMSENFCYSHISMPGRTRVGYVGNTYDDVDCKLSDEGEILVKGPANMLGYYKRDDLTEETFTEDGYLKTGDRGEIDSEGRLKITGRVKELFKTSKGKYVAPVPIENILNSDNIVELSCVSGSGQPKPYAVVQLSEDLQGKIAQADVRSQVEKDLEALLRRVNSEVEGFEQLGFIAVSKKAWTIEDGFLTPTMKIKRATLEDEFGPHLDDWYKAGKKVIWQD